jgi:hypothetical protein
VRLGFGFVLVFLLRLVGRQSLALAPLSVSAFVLPFPFGQSLTLTRTPTHHSNTTNTQGAKGGAEHLARKLQLIEKRKDNVRYSVEHWGDCFLILTNHFKVRRSLGVVVGGLHFTLA